MAAIKTSVPFHQPDFRILRRLDILQQIAMAVVLLLTIPVLCGWLFPAVGRHLPAGWDLMKANTALLSLLCVASIFLNQPRRLPSIARIGRLLGIIVVIVAALTLIEFISGRFLGIDTLLAADPISFLPGRMSSQTAVSFFVIGLVLPGLYARTGLLSRLADAISLLLWLLMLIYVGGYIFDAGSLLGATVHISPQTLTCLNLLTFIVFIRRIEFGAFLILIDDGIGGKTARLAAPGSLLLPFLLAELRNIIARFHLLPEQYGVAVISAALALIAFCFVIVLARRCQMLEGTTREISLRDQLTQLYNRRGFLILAEQNLRLSRRNGIGFFLMFLDIDNLKTLNDNLGHEAGSQHLEHMARVLQGAFRDTDVVGRLGGDEFVVAGYGGSKYAKDFVTRLQLAVDTENASNPSLPPLEYSLGQVAVEADQTDSLEDLIRSADLIMYTVKRSRKPTRLTPTDEPLPSLQPLNR
jgi:diguanylate cyclase (GGDEF)-like protein